MKIEPAEIMCDIQNLIHRFDDFLDDMYDRGAFNCSDPTDKELDNFVSNMKEKYLGVK